MLPTRTLPEQEGHFEVKRMDALKTEVTEVWEVFRANVGLDFYDLTPLQEWRCRLLREDGGFGPMRKLSEVPVLSYAPLD